MKITLAEFEEFEKQYMFEVLKNPDYRLGQAFSNTFPEIVEALSSGDIGYRQQLWLWEARSRDEVLKLVDWYIIK
jgi:hypothetical protein